MLTRLIFIVTLVICNNFSCHDANPDDSNPITPRDSCIVYEYIQDSNSLINAYNKYDSTPGFGYATKVNLFSYFNMASYLSDSKFLFHLISLDENKLTTDYIIFADIPNKIGCFELIEDLRNGSVNKFSEGYFSNWDDDIVVDSYSLDTSRSDNKIEIVSIDTVNKIIEGRFTCSFVFSKDRPKRSPYNLDTMRFFNGYFIGKYKVE
ncbi:MAG: hypothetical protein IPI50_08780 [Saprospiraceae bacterium]|nr:hypothetical protein [Saprospiraceae bacterium]